MKAIAILGITALTALGLSACDNGQCKADGTFAAPASIVRKGGGGGGGHGGGGGGHAGSGGHAGDEGSTGAHEGESSGGGSATVPHVVTGNGGQSCPKRT